MTTFAFRQNLYFDRASGILTFTRSTGNVLVSKAGVSLTYPHLIAFLGRYVQIDGSNEQAYFDPPVMEELREHGILPAPSVAPAPDPPVVGIPVEPPVEPEPKAGPDLPVEPGAPAAKAPAPPPPPPEQTGPVREVLHSRSELVPPSPSARVQSALGKIKLDIVREPGRTKAQEVASGALDDAIRSVVQDLYESLRPQQILHQMGKGNGTAGPDPADHVATATLATQAFGQKFRLNEEELFLLAKCALLYGLKEAEREHLPVIKRNLLSEKPSPSFARRLSQSYHQVVQWLKQQKVTTDIQGVIAGSQFIYYSTPAQQVSPEILVLAVADAFLALKEGGEKFLIIEDIIENRLRNVNKEGSIPIDAIPKLTTDACYNEYRTACCQDLSGGDHCAFTRLSRSCFGLLIFDVSGHDEEASRIRNALVGHLPHVSKPEDPAHFATSLNDFLLGSGFPDDRFVSLLYGVIDLHRDHFRYANAGHNPPYLVRNKEIVMVKKNDLLLNIAPYKYSTYEIPIQREDCLVFYTDGLTEARKQSRDELFGSSRLEEAIATHNLGGMKAKRAVDTILRVVEDEGFAIEDDITVQVYRHL